MDMVETPDTLGAYPRLSDAQIAALAAHGQRRPTQAGDVLFREGDRGCDFVVVLAGMVAIVEGYGTPRQRTISVHGPGRFLGELGLVTGLASFVSAVVVEPGEVLTVPAQRLREVVARDSALGDLILRCYVARRSILIDLGTGFRIVGSKYSPDTRRLREFAARNRLPYRWLDPEEEPQAEAMLRELSISPEETPVVIWGTTVLRNPSNAELARAIGLAVPDDGTGDCDVVVVGAGPAGLAASVYAASEGLNTIALDATATGGQAGTSPRIENYLGFPSGISGAELADRAVIQAEKFGARITVPARATGLRQVGGDYEIALEDGTALRCRTVVIATGVQYRKLDVPGLDRFEGISVYHAATHYEAGLCRGDQVAVVGGGNSAGQAALFLAQHTARVYLLVRHADLSRDMSRYLVDQIERSSDITVLTNTEVRELVGDKALEAIVVEDTGTGQRQRLAARAMFVFIGSAPFTGWLADEVALDEHGFVRTGPDAAPDDLSEGAPLALESSRRGVFAVGDVRSGSIKRVASAVGEGAQAIRLVHERLG